MTRDDAQLIEYMGRVDRERIAPLAASGWPILMPEQPQAGAQQPARVLAYTRWHEAYLERWSCRHQSAALAAEEGVRQSCVAADRMLEAMCRREAGLAARALGEYRRARSELERAVDLFARLDRAAWEIHALGNLATLSWYEGMPEQSLDLARHALERCASADMMLLRRLPLGDMGAAAMVLGAMELARQCLEESLALSQQAGDRAQELVSRTHLGWLAVRLRRPDEAESHFRAGLELAVAIRSCTEQSWLHAGFAETYRLAGRLPEASEHARRAVELAGASAAVYDQKLAHWVLRRLGEGDAKPVE